MSGLTLPAPLGVRGSVFGTTRGPGNNDAKPRPKAFLFSTFSSFFSAATVEVISRPLDSLVHPANRPSQPLRAYIDTHRSIRSTNIYIDEYRSKSYALFAAVESAAAARCRPSNSLASRI